MYFYSFSILGLPIPKRTGTCRMGFYLFDFKKVNKKLLAKNMLYGISQNVSAMITHFGGVLPEDVALIIKTCNTWITGYLRLAFQSYST